MKWHLFLGILALAATACVNTRTKVPVAPPLAFRADSIKVHRSGDLTGTYSGFFADGFAAHAPLIGAIGSAYHVPYPSLTNVLILGGPAWVRAKTDVYDIEATAGNGTVPPWLSPKVRNERMRGMLQKLVAIPPLAACSRDQL